MRKIRLTKIFTFETAHALHGYDGNCKNIHGHSYKLEVTVRGAPINDDASPKNGMLIDFGDLKKIVNTNIVNLLDHAILLNENSPHVKLGEELKKGGHNVKMVPYQPSCENMILDFAEIIKTKLPDNIELVKMKLRETETSFSEWLASDN